MQTGLCGECQGLRLKFFTALLHTIQVIADLQLNDNTNLGWWETGYIEVMGCKGGNKMTWIWITEGELMSISYWPVRILSFRFEASATPSDFLMPNSLHRFLEWERFSWYHTVCQQNRLNVWLFHLALPFFRDEGMSECSSLLVRFLNALRLCKVYSASIESERLK